ncbi:MAG: biopolymer transporter ExbD [Deferribacteres bacterium]|nr:biopolymer transporter ExbD [Deferribacteres bacterium]
MKKRSSKVISDVNVTSLVDVTMVLLIIFIIAAPFMRAGVKVELPKAENRSPQPREAILIAIDGQKQIYVNQKQVSVDNLSGVVKQLVSAAPQLPVLVEGDAAVPYGEVIALMDAVRNAGVENVGLVLETPSRRR